MSGYLYVTLNEEDKILIFNINAQTGKLAAQGEIAAVAAPGNLAIDPGRRFIYASCRGDRKNIAAFRRNLETGMLSPINSTPLEFEPGYLFVDRKGKFLLSTYFLNARVAVHEIGADGTLSTSNVQWFNTAMRAHSVKIDPSNRFVFVPHTAGKDGANAVFQFKFNEATGRLTPNTPDRVPAEANAGPRHCCFHLKLDIYYVCNEAGSSVTAYRFDHINGALTAFQTISTLPDNYPDKSFTAEICISPSGKFIYVSNRGHNSIACFSVDEGNGRLTAIRHTPTEPEVRGFSLSPDGDFLYAAGQQTNRLVSYRVNKDTGELTPLDTYNVGKAPWYVLSV
jgi:6-phosphogluconolactonase